MIRIVEYADVLGRLPYSLWFKSLEATAAAKVARAVHRLADGNFSNVKGVGAGVFERTIDFGPGYRVYFGKDGERVVILLGGSTKSRQSEAISIAKARWWDYGNRKTI